MPGPVRLFTVIALVSLPTVMYGGYALMGLLERGVPNDRQNSFFRAGHAHAGVLLVLVLVALQVLDRSELGDTGQWVACFPPAVRRAGAVGWVLPVDAAHAPRHGDHRDRRRTAGRRDAAHRVWGGVPLRVGRGR